MKAIGINGVISQIGLMSDGLKDNKYIAKEKYVIDGISVRFDASKNEAQYVVNYAVNSGLVNRNGDILEVHMNTERKIKMTQETKDAFEQLINVILFGDIDEIPWSYIKDKIPEETHFEIANGDDKEACIRMAIASTIRWMIKTEQIKSPW